MVLHSCIQFDIHVDVTDFLLSDKSIIPCRERWIHEFDRQAHRTLYGHFPVGPPPTSKSAVVAYLEKDVVDVKDIINTI